MLRRAADGQSGPVGERLPSNRVALTRDGLSCGSVDALRPSTAAWNDTDPLLTLEGWIDRIELGGGGGSGSSTATSHAETLLCALQAARRAVLLFPHHDTVTGTSQVRHRLRRSARGWAA